MKDIGRIIILTEKKHSACTNDVTKLILSDMIGLVLEENDKTWFNLSNNEQKSRISEYIDRLPDIYHGQLQELRAEQKKKSKQLEITDPEIRPDDIIKEYYRQGQSFL